MLIGAAAVGIAIIAAPILVPAAVTIGAVGTFAVAVGGIATAAGLGDLSALTPTGTVTSK